MKKKATRIGIGATIVVAVLLVICQIISKPWRYVSIKSCVGVSEEEFMQKMEKLDEYYNTTNFSENAKQLLNTAQEKGYNEYNAPAIMCIATNGGNETNGNYNYWPVNTIIDKRVEEILGGTKVSLSFATPKVSIEYFFNVLEKCGDVTYEEFSRKWLSIGKVSYSPIREWKTNESDSYRKELYETVRWIKSL